LSDQLISVISVYYNRADLVSDSLASVLRQSHGNLELIVIDDGSTDDTWERIKRIRDPRIRALRHENQGFVASIRKAVDLCSGSFVAVHGSGDVSHRDRIALQLAAFERRPDLGLVGSYVENVNSDKGFSTIYRPTAANAEDMCRSRFLIHGGVMFRKDVYDAVGGYRTFFDVGQDHDLWLRMAERSAIGVVPEALYTRHIRTDGVGGGSPGRRLRQIELFNVAVDAHRTRMAGLPDPVDAGQAGCPVAITAESAKILALIGMELAALGDRGLADRALRLGMSSDRPLLPAAIRGLLRALWFSDRLSSAAFRALLKGWYGLKPNRPGDQLPSHDEQHRCASHCGERCPEAHADQPQRPGRLPVE
jgi:glycosyltransferase involved in cell wall biosynthesis